MLKPRKLATVFMTSLVIFAWSLPVTDVHSLSTTPVSSALILDGGFDVIPDGAGNFYILSYSSTSDNCNLIYCDNSSDTPALSTVSVRPGTVPTKGYISALYTSPYMYIFYPQKVVQAQIRGTNAQATDHITVALDTPKHSQGLAVGANNDVFMCASDSSSVSVYDPSLKDNTNLIATESLSAITTDISKNFLYAATNNTLYRYKIEEEKEKEKSYAFEEPTISGNFAPFKFLTDNIFITSATTPCKICILNDSEFKLDSSVDMQATMSDYDKGVAIAGFDNASILAKTAEKVVSRIRCSDGAVTGKIEFSEKILAVATSGEKTIVVTGSTTATNIHLIIANDITEITPPEPTEPEGGDGTDPDSPYPEEPPADTTIETTEGYEVGDNVISKIPAGTTLGALKNGLTFNGSLVLKDSGGNTKTGASTKIATGYTVTFVKDGAEYKKFTLIVEGDVTGSGNISSKSISALANHLLGKSELDGVFLEAANLSGDGDLSTVDLLLMYKQTQK